MRKFKISVDGVSYNVEVEEVGGVVSAVEPVASASAVAASAAPVVKEAPKAAPAPAGGAPVKAPMPGMIVKFLVANGAQVKRGQAILVLEAMKMENDIVADSDGAVSFTVSQGANVNTGDVLATIA